MAVLARAVLVLLLPACYAPDLRDCTVTCVAATDCASGQVCGPDSYCASPQVAGNCTTPDANEPDGSLRDGGPRDAAPRDAAMVDSRPPVDAIEGRADMHIIANGDGRITASGIGACDKLGPTEGDCTFSVTIPRSVTLTATPHVGSKFDKWEMGPCAPASVMCSFEMTTAILAKAKFKPL
ncbi:MAG: hypothetical protein WKG01_18050 [Kofleriaceae bacterium]